MSYNPYPPAPGGAGDPYEAFFATPQGQNYSRAEESRTAQLRRIADHTMSIQKQEIDIKAQTLRQQGRNAEADQMIQRETLKLARERLAIETELKREELGLQRAESYAKFASGPDMMFMFRDFQRGLQRAGQGLGPQPYGTGDAPQMRTWEDFQAAQSGQWTGASSGASPGGGGGGAGQAAGGGTDPRVQAATAVVKALPPSEGTGHDDNDLAALSAVENIFRASKPGSFERMRPGQQVGFAAGLSKRGYWAPDAIAQMRRNAPGQGSVRAA